jgi:cyclophilin family peptidyl-prolyl cis-trans isomerase
LIAQAVADSNSTFWKEEAIQIWETNDMGAQALLAAGVKEVKLLQDLKPKWRILMEKRLTTLQLPAEVETYNEIARALSSLFPDQKPSYPDHQPKPRISIDQHQWESLQFHREYEMEVDIHGEKHNIHFFVQELDHPITAMHFKSLVQSGFYNNKYIHRYVPNFVSQGGCPRGDGMGSLDSVIPSEFTEDSFTLGHIGWASAGPHTESCQIFFMTSDAPHLDGRYTNMGAVYKGEEWLSKMTIGTKINWIKLIP